MCQPCSTFESGSRLAAKLPCAVSHRENAHSHLGRLYSISIVFRNSPFIPIVRPYNENYPNSSMSSATGRTIMLMQFPGLVASLSESALYDNNLRLGPFWITKTPLGLSHYHIIPLLKVLAPPPFSPSHPFPPSIPRR